LAPTSRRASTSSTPTRRRSRVVSLTGDTNIVSIALVLQYVIEEPAEFLFRSESPQALINGIAAALTETVLGMPVDEVLTTGRLAIQDQVKAATQARLDDYRTGIRITSSNIMTIPLDETVAQAFQEVTDAMADREKSRNEARMHAKTWFPRPAARPIRTCATPRA
jgi:membrane protease subunit HflK